VQFTVCFSRRAGNGAALDADEIEMQPTSAEEDAFMMQTQERDIVIVRHGGCKAAMQTPEMGCCRTASLLNERCIWVREG
jgi:hypothetical protein